MNLREPGFTPHPGQPLLKKSRSIFTPRDTQLGLVLIWGRCYDHNLLQMSQIIGEKIGVFLKYQCYEQFFSKFSFVLSQNVNFFANFLGENI
jgi:hypothetical protein